MNKRIVSIATALLIAFSLMPATAQTGTGYDPRADYNGDGVLDIKDVHELRDARNEIDTLELLRAHDIYAWRTARAEDQRRIVALEWAVQGQPWPACGER